MSTDSREACKGAGHSLRRGHLDSERACPSTLAHLFFPPVPCHPAQAQVQQQGVRPRLSSHRLWPWNRAGAKQREAGYGGRGTSGQTPAAEGGQVAQREKEGAGNCPP